MTLKNKNLVTNYSSAKFSWLKSGGNIFINAGCYNQEIKDKLISVIYYDINQSKIFEK